MTNGEKLERRRGLERGGGGSENDEEEVGLSSGSLVMGRVISVHLLTKSFAFIDEDDLMEKLKHEVDDGVDNEDNKSDDDSNTTEMKTTRSNSDGEISSLVAEGGPMGIIGWGGR
ncbi:hypothetical protein Bca101_072190 [Brassica carinata]